MNGLYRMRNMRYGIQSDSLNRRFRTGAVRFITGCDDPRCGTVPARDGSVPRLASVSPPTLSGKSRDC